VSVESMQPQAPVVEPVRFRVQQEAALRRSERKPGALWQAFARTGLAVLLSAAVSAGAWQAYRWATTSPLFAITEIRFAGLDHATERELLRRSGLSLGENLFHADLARASKAIEAPPRGSSAGCRRA
jgi:cell division septal protein FtsQ